MSTISRFSAMTLAIVLSTFWHAASLA